MSRIRAGDAAPDCPLHVQSGEVLHLSEFRQHQIVILFFYPRDFTSICTKEACAFRDAYEQFVEAGAIVIGVSGDSPQRHRDFAAHHRLPFLLVSDRDGSLRKAFGVPKPLGIIPGRATYIIDTQGIVRLVFSSLWASQQHVSEALKIVRQLQTTP